MITETDRDKALIAAANGKPAFVISQKGDVPEIINLTKMLHNALTEKDNVFIADIGVHPEVTIPSLSTEPTPIPTAAESEKPRVIPSRRIAKGRKSTLDDGKIMALHNAGWSDEKIAVEMHVTPKTIGKHLEKIMGG